MTKLCFDVDESRKCIQDGQLKLFGLPLARNTCTCTHYNSTSLWSIKSKIWQIFQSSKGKFLEVRKTIRSVFLVISKTPDPVLTWYFLPSVPKLSQQPDFPHPKPKTTRSPAAPPTELGKCVGPGLRILTAYPSSSYRKYNSNWGSIAQIMDKAVGKGQWVLMLCIFLAMLVITKCS